MCTAPAEIWKVRNKGLIKQGYDADLVLVDLAKEATIRDHEQVAKCRWTKASTLENGGNSLAPIAVADQAKNASARTIVLLLGTIFIAIGQAGRQTFMYFGVRPARAARITSWLIGNIARSSQGRRHSPKQSIDRSSPACPTKSGRRANRRKTTLQTPCLVTHCQ